ncbi:addiction module protein [Sulfurimonas sp. MAG313]|nr:addiction module protein [Sulfurimonas sp. MAG313]MDF1882108.1 addiction module protein [Sulfurimonas sp. MAG313]
MLAKDEIYYEAMQMQPLEKAKLIEKLMLSLDMPTSEVEDAWKEEIDIRVDAYTKGELKTIPMEEVLKKYED